MSEPLTGEERLCAAVLVRAVIDFDREWIDEDDLGASKDYFTFNRCCQALGIDSSTLRRTLLDPAQRVRTLWRASAWAASQGQRTTGRQIGRCFT